MCDRHIIPASTPMNDKALALLGAVQGGLISHFQKEFAESLANQQLAGKKPLSEKQAYWLNKLYQQTFNEPKREAEDLGVDLKPIVAMFDKVAQKLKYPKIRIEIGGEECILSRTNSGPNTGVVNIVRDGNRDWLGRVTRDGKWYAGPKAETMPMVEDFLVSFAADPARIAAEYGRKSGHCCFCNSELTSDGSTHVGYGPHCAKQWGLPWTAKPKKEAA